MTTPQFSQAANGLNSSAIREILKLTAAPDMISFAGGLPSTKTFPVAQLHAAFDQVLSKQPYVALQYSTTEGYLPLREWIAQDFKEKGVDISPDEVLLVSGSQQGIEMLGKLFIDPGAKVLVEAPTYLGALQAFSLQQPQYEEIPTDENGLIPQALTAEKAAGARFAYCLPNFQNPTGLTLSLERRRQWVQRCAELNVPIIEDDPYGDIRYRGERLPSLLQLGREAGATVIRLGSFSKILAPGLRVAYIVAPRAIIDKLIQIKQATDLHSPNINQMAIYECIKDGLLKTHIPTIQKLYGQQCDYMLDAIQQYFPDTVKWTVPEGGMFLWLTLPEHADSSKLLRQAVEQEKVAFVPGEPFYIPGHERHNTLRLSFVTVDKDKIYQGIQGLSRVFQF